VVEEKNKIDDMLTPGKTTWKYFDFSFNW
jgi:hypothetical protein